MSATKREDSGCFLGDSDSRFQSSTEEGSFSGDGLAGMALVLVSAFLLRKDHQWAL